MNPAAIVAIFLLVGLSFYFMFTYTGPFRWLAELQMMVMNSYSEEFTLILTMLVLILTALGIVKVVKVAVKSMGVGGVTSPAAPTAGGATEIKSRGMQFSGIIVWPFMGLIAFAIGGFMYWRGATAGPLTAITAKELEDGKKPASSYLSVEGVPLWKETISFKSGSVECYVPLVSKDWKGDSVSAYAQVREDDLPRPSKQLEMKTFKGVTAVGGLPGPVRVIFEKGNFKPAAGYLVIETKEEPAKLMGFGKWPMIVGAALVVAGLSVWGVKRMVMGRG
jgi:hypothetical protein